MTWPRVARTIVLALAMVSLGVHPASAAPATEQASTSLDLLPELLIEPPAPNETQRLLAESRRTTSYCALLVTLDGMEPPNPEEIDELVVFAQAYHQHTTFLDRRSKVQDPTSAEGSKVALPDEAEQGIEIERRAMYAFFARMLAARTLHRAGTIDDEELERRVRYGFVKLMSSGFAEADRGLQKSRTGYCG
jgi:hypothetical protein